MTADMTGKVCIVTGANRGSARRPPPRSPAGARPSS